MFFSERRPEIWGHRGWPARYPDNVLAGIRAASTVAARVEIDVRRAADGQLVLSHDPELAGLPVVETPWARLAELDLGDGHRPIRLIDLVTQAPEVALNIEIKNSPVDPDFDPELVIVDQVAALCRPNDVVSSFHWPSVDRMRSLRPDLATGLLFEATIPARYAIEHARGMGHRAIVPHWPLVSQEVIATARSRGLEVVTWTVDDPATAGRLAAWGVDAIITNDPGTLVAGLDPSEQTS